MRALERADERAAAIRVLVVDDDTATVESMAAVLESEVQVEVTTCTSPTAALRALSAVDFDVICSDYRMPEMTGIELLGRASARAPHVGCLLITGANDYERREGEALYYVLLKPYDPERLIRLVRQLGKVAQMKRSVSALRGGDGQEPS